MFEHGHWHGGVKHNTNSGWDREWQRWVRDFGRKVASAAVIEQPCAGNIPPRAIPPSAYHIKERQSAAGIVLPKCPQFISYFSSPSQSTSPVKCRTSEGLDWHLVGGSGGCSCPCKWWCIVAVGTCHFLGFTLRVERCRAALALQMAWNLLEGWIWGAKSARLAICIFLKTCLISFLSHPLFSSPPLFNTHKDTLSHSVSWTAATGLIFSLSRESFDHYGINAVYTFFFILK